MIFRFALLLFFIVAFCSTLSKAFVTSSSSRNIHFSTFTNHHQQHTSHYSAARQSSPSAVFLFLPKTAAPRSHPAAFVRRQQHQQQPYRNIYNSFSSLLLPPPAKTPPKATTALKQVVSGEDKGSGGDDDLFEIRTTLALVGGQSLLIGFAAFVAYLFGTPNWGFGSGVSFDLSSIKTGFLFALPLGVLAAALDLVEDRFPPLKDVTTATQRSVLSLLGRSFKPAFALATSIGLGLAAGFGEEMLFRGVFQYELAARFGATIGVAVSSVVFGLLHAVTPLYAGLAGMASVYFGALYQMSDNLAVPITCHVIYDIGALLYAHWTISQLSEKELQAVIDWEGPGSS